MNNSELLRKIDDYLVSHEINKSGLAWSIFEIITDAGWEEKKVFDAANCCACESAKPTIIHHHCEKHKDLENHIVNFNKERPYTIANRMIYVTKTTKCLTCGMILEEFNSPCVCN